MTRSAPVRALHFFQELDRDGVGTWMIQMLRRLDRSRVQIDVVLQNPEPGVYEDEARELGTQVFRCTEPGRPWRYARQVRQVLHDQGPYDVMHAHMGHWCGFLMRLADQAEVPVRIVHSHLDVASLPRGASPPWWLYYAWMQHWIDRYATAQWAVSERAGRSLFGEHWSRDPRRWMLPAGIDLAPLCEPVDRPAVRAELGLAEDELVVGHVGRFSEQKNHGFLVDVFGELVGLEPRARLLLVGEGELRPAIERRVREKKGLGERVIFAGSRPDVARLMRGAMDVFVLPSLYEGLPRVGLEAQAAGLPVVVSSAVTAEMTVVREAVHWLAPTEPARRWAERLQAAARSGDALDQADALNLLQASAFNIERSPDLLEEGYASQLEKQAPPG